MSRTSQPANETPARESSLCLAILGYTADNISSETPNESNSGPHYPEERDQSATNLPANIPVNQTQFLCEAPKISKQPTERCHPRNLRELVPKPDKASGTLGLVQGMNGDQRTYPQVEVSERQH